jgi:hypothetical protein
MTYRVSYEDALTVTSGSQEGVTRTEYFRTEFEALNRARQLMARGDYDGVVVHHGTDVVLAGVLHLKPDLQMAGLERSGWAEA